jgi:hypothetical protein
MQSDTDNTSPKIAHGNREIRVSSPLKLTPVRKEASIPAKAEGKGSGVNSREGSEPSWRTPGRSDIKCLLRWLDPRLTQEDFPIALQFTTHGLRTTLIFEHAPSRETCGSNLPHSHEPEKQN